MPKPAAEVVSLNMTTQHDPNDNEAPEPVAGQRSIQSVVISFRLVAALEAAGGPMPLKDLAAAAGMPASRAHPYLASLKAVGLVTQDGEGGRYDFGPRTLSLGLTALSRLDVWDAALDAMRWFRDQTEEAVHLSIWSGQGPVIVSRLDGGRRVSLAIRLGFALPLDRSASGRIFLAFLPEAATGKAAEALKAEIEAVRREAIAVTDGLLNAGFAAISVPVFDHAGELAAALTTLGAAGQLDTSPDGRTCSHLRQAGQIASAALGFDKARKGLAQPAGPQDHALNRRRDP